MVDLDSLDITPGANAGHEIELLDVDGNPMGIFVTVLGRDSTEYQKRVDAVQQARVERMFKNGAFRPAAITTPAQDRAKQQEILAAITKSWRSTTADGKSVPTVTRKGVALECTYENALALYRDLPLLREQVQEAVDARANFVKGA